jgi:hypothetical protein
MYYVKPYESIDDRENFIDRAGCKMVFELCKLIPEQTANNKNILCFSIHMKKAVKKCTGVPLYFKFQLKFPS